MIINIKDKKNKKEIIEQIEADLEFDGFNIGMLKMENLAEQLMMEQEESLEII